LPSAAKLSAPQLDSRGAGFTKVIARGNGTGKIRY
jgi:hypothetical protein